MILGTLWDLFFYQKARQTDFKDDSKRSSKKGSEKSMIFERLEPRKVSPRAGGSMILRFCPTPGNCSILEVFWYLLFELLGSPILEKMLFRGA